jgi:cytoskeletal protein RodZ
MRVKMRCPECGAWFSLHVGVEGGRGDEKHEHASEELPAAAATAKPVRESPSLSAPAGNVRWIVAVCAVVAIVIIGVFVVRPMISRQDAASVLEEGTASPAAVKVGEIEAETPPADVGEETGSEGPGATETAGESEPDPPMETAGEAADESATETAEQTAAEPGAEPATESALPSTQEPVGPTSGMLELEVVASERCWVQITSDGRVVGDLTLEAGERRTWRAGEFFELSVGAGDAVELYLNGEPLGTAGSGPRVVENLRVDATAIADTQSEGSL